MKTTASIYFEQLMDKETEEIYKTLTEEQIQEFIGGWKEAIENFIRSEITSEAQNIRINVEVINE